MKEPQRLLGEARMNANSFALPYGYYQAFANRAALVLHLRRSNRITPSLQNNIAAKKQGYG